MKGKAKGKGKGKGKKGNGKGKGKPGIRRARPGHVPLATCHPPSALTCAICHMQRRQAVAVALDDDDAARAAIRAEADAIEAMMADCDARAEAAMSAALEALSKANASIEPWGQRLLPKIDADT